MLISVVKTFQMAVTSQLTVSEKSKLKKVQRNCEGIAKQMLLPLLSNDSINVKPLKEKKKIDMQWYTGLWIL